MTLHLSGLLPVMCAVHVPFSYDISDMVCFGQEENQVSVKVVHDDLADSRWFTGSGITRKVTVCIEEKVHPAEYGCVFRTEQVWKDREMQAAVWKRPGFLLSMNR